MNSIENNKIVFELEFGQPEDIALSDYIQLTFDFSSFDRNWSGYTTTINQTEYGPVKTFQISIRKLY